MRKPRNLGKVLQGDLVATLARLMPPMTTRAEAHPTPRSSARGGTRRWPSSNAWRGRAWTPSTPPCWPHTARDEAEREWRRHKDPAPLATRLGWAQKRLDKAVTLQAKTREQLAELEKELAERKAALMERLDTDTERVGKRRRELDMLQAEAGGAAPRTGRGDEAGDVIRQACEQTCTAMRKHVGPALTALAEQLDTGSDAWTTLTAIVSTLNESHDTLQQAVDKADGVDVDSRASRYHIYDDDEDASEWSESHDLPSGGHRGDGPQAMCTGNDGAAAAQPAAAAAAATDATDAAGWQVHRLHQQGHQPHHQQGTHWESRWRDQHGEQRGDGGCGSTGMAEEQAWTQWTQAGWATDGAKWMYCGHGKWQRSSWADDWEREQMEVEAPPSGEEDAGAPQRKNRRVDGAGGSGRQQEPAAPTAAAAADSSASSDPAKAHQEMLTAIITRAVAAGVQPITHGGDDLQMLDIHQLSAWAAENLPQTQ